MFKLKKVNPKLRMLREENALLKMRSQELNAEMDKLEKMLEAKIAEKDELGRLAKENADAREFIDAMEQRIEILKNQI